MSSSRRPGGQPGNTNALKHGFYASKFKPHQLDDYNCTPGTDETWYLNGTANPADQTVTFTSCNNGGFTGSGVVSYAGGTLTGDATCTYKNGTIAISLALGR